MSPAASDGTGGAGRKARPAVVTVLGKSGSPTVGIADRLVRGLVAQGVRVIVLRPGAGMELDVADEARRFSAFDLILVVGLQRAPVHPIEVFRAAAGHESLLLAAGESLALVTDADVPHERRYGPEETEELARFIAERLDELREY